ncbi:MAG: hypothetical protein LBD02_09860 [Christensenellaceae bacterium]|nr:hypothetical protein [Christensenellaceae bacterium]
MRFFIVWLRREWSFISTTGQLDFLPDGVKYALVYWFPLAYGLWFAPEHLVARQLSRWARVCLRAAMGLLFLCLHNFWGRFSVFGLGAYDSRLFLFPAAFLLGSAFLELFRKKKAEET